MQLDVFRYFALHLGLNREAEEAARQLRSRVMHSTRFVAGIQLWHWFSHRLQTLVQIRASELAMNF
jgi:hypothetical protein